MPGWFDLYDWPIGVGVRDDEEGLKSAVDVVEGVVRGLEEKGVERNRIVVGGFSQGGAVALRSVYHANTSTDTTATDGEAAKAYGACVSLSGWVTYKGNDVSPASKDVPLFLAHGTQDDKVLFEQQQHAEVILGAEGGVRSIESKTYRMGHSSHPQEMVDFANFLNTILFDVQASE